MAVVVARRRAPSSTPRSCGSGCAAGSPAFKVPKHVEFADELPKTATGKVRKPDLRDRYVPTEETPA